MYKNNSVESLIKKSETAFAELALYRQTFDDAYEYLLPQYNTYGHTKSTSMQNNTKQMTSSPMVAAFDFVNTLQSTFTPSFTEWAKLVAGADVQDDKRETVNLIAEKITKRFFEYLHSSNFSDASAETYFNLGIGTACLWVHEGGVDDHPFNFVSSPMHEIGLTEGVHGKIDGKFREFNVQACHIEATWGYSKDLNLSPQIKEAQQENPNKEFKLLECQYYDYTERLWRYDVIDYANKVKILERTSLTEGCITPRWIKIPGKPYGVGVFTLAMPDIKTLNKMNEFSLSAMALSVFPPHMVDTQRVNVNHLRLSPKSVIPLNSKDGFHDGQQPIQALQSTQNLQLQEFVINKYEQGMKKTMLSPKLPDPQPNPATRFELAQRIAEAQNDIGPAYGRMVNEFVAKLFARGIDILIKKGLLDDVAMQSFQAFNEVEEESQIPPIEELRVSLREMFTKVNGHVIKVQILSPIAQNEQMQEVQRFMQAIELIASIDPSLVPIVIETGGVAQWLYGKIGASMELLKTNKQGKPLSENEVNDLMQQAMQQAQAMQNPDNQQVQENIENQAIDTIE